MTEVKWVKLYVDMFDKRKIKKIRRLPDGDKLLLLWIMLLVTAGKCNAGGMIYITENVPFDEEDLADEFDIELNTVRLALDIFVRLDMITLTADGFITINGWEEYQNIDGMEKIKEQNRIRQAKFKEKKRIAEGNVTVTLPLTLGNATEEEGRKENKDKEIHSFNHSLAREEKFDSREEIRMAYLGGSLGGNVVMLGEEQFNDLLDKLSVDELQKYIGIVRDCERNGRHYRKPHYIAILEMVEKDRKKRS